MFKSKKRVLAGCLLIAVTAAAIFLLTGCRSEKEALPGIVQTVYPTEDPVVADYIATAEPYHADKKGKLDSAGAIQRALDDCSKTGGGTVWLPAGSYRLAKNLVIPAHVTLRGDWQDPDQGKKYGTILIADIPSQEAETPGLIRVGGSSGLIGVTVYYPNQSASKPVPYPYTIEIPGRAYAEEDYMHQSVINVTLLNSYRGISVNKTLNGKNGTTGEEFYIRDVKGTALQQALRAYDCADVGRCVNIRFNNEYWAKAGDRFNPQSREALDTYTRANGTGFEMADMEFCEFYNMSFHDYKVGMCVVQGFRAKPSATLFGIDLQNCNVALDADQANTVLGVKFSNSTFQANQGEHPVAIRVNTWEGTPVFFNNCTIGGGAEKAVSVINNSSVSFFNCTFDDWTGPYAIDALTGTILVEGCTFKQELTAERKAIKLGELVEAATLLGNKFSGSAYFLDNTSSGDIKRQDTGYNFDTPGVESHTFKAEPPRPSTGNLYNVKDLDASVSERSAAGDGQADDTPAIQAALDAAGKKGGGTVYLPAGQYKISTHLTVPSNVELRGSEAVPHRGDAKGTVLCVYEGKETVNPDGDTAFITLKGKNAGLRGLSVYYPEQAENAGGFATYPWAVRGDGKGVYAVNICFVNAFKGIDFGYGTNRCDSHYISGITGTCLKNAIAVGNSEEGWVEDCQFNGTYWVRTSLPNALPDDKLFKAAFAFMQKEQTVFWFGNAQKEHLLNDFAYGTSQCYYFTTQPGGGAGATAINCSADGTYSCFVIEGTGEKGLTLVNSDCSVNAGGPVIRITGGTARIFNLGTAQASTNNQSIYITGGKSVLQGIDDKSGPCRITGGSTRWNGVILDASGAAVPQIAISGDTSGSIAGCAVKAVVNIENQAEKGVTVENNVSN